VTLSKRILVHSRRLFSLSEDSAEELAIAEIKGSVDFRGANLWALVLAIVIASIGLNVNSTAVIIGAMLISPLMGPIMGAGLALGINDVELLRRSTRNLATAAGASIVTSTLYFAVSPLAEAQSELLARTRPTIYDVLIALAGGTAGIVAATRRSSAKGNVVAGVAIATALMPPLCTAGYGLATGSLAFFAGALYLFVINSLFIGLATLGVVRLLRFKHVVDVDPEHARRMRLRIAVVTTLAVLPSVFVFWRVVLETRYETAARRYVAESHHRKHRGALRARLVDHRDDHPRPPALRRNAGCHGAAPRDVWPASYPADRAPTGGLAPRTGAAWPDGAHGGPRGPVPPK
jgi:uncharacterized hydrophobic protein (TIGR00271 family)